MKIEECQYIMIVLTKYIFGEGYKCMAIKGRECRCFTHPYFANVVDFVATIAGVNNTVPDGMSLCKDDRVSFFKSDNLKKSYLDFCYKFSDKSVIINGADYDQFLQYVSSVEKKYRNNEDKKRKFLDFMLVFLGYRCVENTNDKIFQLRNRLLYEYNNDIRGDRYTQNFMNFIISEVLELSKSKSSEEKMYVDFLKMLSVLMKDSANFEFLTITADKDKFES